MDGESRRSRLIRAGDEGIGGEDGAADFDELADIHGLGLLPGEFDHGRAVVLVGGLLLNADDGALGHFVVIGGNNAVAGFEGSKKLPKAVVEHAIGFLEVLLKVVL